MWNFGDDSDKPENLVTDADWAAEIEGVKPLKKDERVLRTHMDAYEVEEQSIEEEFEEWPEKHKAYNPTYSWDDAQKYERRPVTPLPTTVEPFTDIQETVNVFSARRPGIDLPSFDRLKKGKVPFQRKIDLHGMVEDEAWSALMDFLTQAYASGCRAVLVVHGKGKGYGEQGRMGIIKSNISSWLRSSAVVLAYHTTQAKHGGSGSVCVMIRKNRDLNTTINEEDD